MSVQLTVAGEVFQYPSNRDSPSWGEEASSWAVAVSSVLSSIGGTGYILQTSAPIANNQATPASITGLLFDITTVRGAIIEYSIYRNTTGGGATELVEVGSFYAGFKSVAGTWDFAGTSSSNSGVTLSITNAGQVQYISSNMTGGAYTGVIKFQARAFVQ